MTPAPEASRADSEEPVPAVPTHETRPVWTQTVPVKPDASDLDSPTEGAEQVEGQEEEPLPPVTMSKGDPDWSHTETPEPEVPRDGPQAARPAQKPTPEWAQTVPTSPGEAIAL